MVARDVAGVALCGHQPRVVAEALPDARARAVGERRSLDLIGGGRRAPQEIVGENRLRHFLSLSALIGERSEEHTSELQSLMRHSSAVFCLKQQNNPNQQPTT